MGRRRKLEALTDFQRALKNKYGLGEGDSYKPWLRVQDVRSRGNSGKIQSIKVNREHHMLSEHESCFFYIAKLSVMWLSFGYISTILSGWIPHYWSRSNQLGDIQIVDSVNTKSLMPLVITSSGSNDISCLFRRFWDDISGRRSNKCTSTK